MDTVLETARFLLRIGSRPKRFLPLEVLVWIARRDKKQAPKGMKVEYGPDGASLRMEDDSETDSEDTL